MRYADIPHLVQAVLGVGFFATPILYDAANLSNEVRWLFSLNPLTHLLGCFRAPLVYGELPPIGTALLAGLCATVLSGVGWVLFSLKEDEIVQRA